MKTVRIYGMAPNLVWAPLVVPPDVEVWCCNNPVRAYRNRPTTHQEWTRWFNMHSERHMTTAYPRGYAWFQRQTTGRIVLQRRHEDIPRSEAFPREAVMQFFGHRYFTFSAAWFIALAIYEGFERIELYGFRLSHRKLLYAKERPCFFYWVEEARRRGIEVLVPEDVGVGEAGDPWSYDGPLYGYETT